MTVWILSLVYLTAGGDIGVGFSQQPGTAVARLYESEAACQEAAKERLEHAPKYVIKARSICTPMDKPQ